MSESAAEEWLTVAVSELAEFAALRPERFLSGCKKARRECTHYGQIVPTVLLKEFYEWERQDGSHRRGLAALCSKAPEHQQISNNSNVTRLITDAAKGCRA